MEIENLPIGHIGTKDDGAVAYKVNSEYGIVLTFAGGQSNTKGNLSPLERLPGDWTDRGHIKDLAQSNPRSLYTYIVDVSEVKPGQKMRYSNHVYTRIDTRSEDLIKSCNSKNIVFISEKGVIRFFLKDSFCYIEKPPAIMIGDNEVEFTSDGIKVGCTNVPMETIEQIYNTLKGK